MSTNLSPENQQFIASAVARGDFRDQWEAINVGVELLRRGDEFVADVEAGTRQLATGQYHDYDRDALRELVKRMKIEGRNQLAQQQTKS